MPDELLWAVGCSYRGMPTTRSDVRNVYGGSACFRRDVFSRFGGFDASLGRTAAGLAGCEETEFCLRVRNQSLGLRFVYEPASVIHHRVPTQRQKASYLLRRCRGEGRSKAILRTLTGGDGHPLGSEAVYLTRTVPRGIATGIVLFFRGDKWGLVRAALLAAAVVTTLVSYEATRLGIHFRRSTFQPAPATALEGPP
jgi:GT2 family glycosyltransferase